MRKNLTKIASFFAMLACGAVCVNVPTANAESAKSPVCQMVASPNEIEVGGATTLTWIVSSGAVEAKLYPKGSIHLIADVLFLNSWRISGIVDSRDYTLIVKNVAGETASCDAHIEVQAEPSSGPSPIVVASKDKGPKEIPSKIKKYKGSSNKEIYKMINGWKKFNQALYWDYKNAYKKYAGLSNDERRELVKGEEYKKYKKYKIYRKYKEYRKLKNK